MHGKTTVGSQVRRVRKVQPILEQLEPRLLLDAALEETAIELFEGSPAVFVENQGQWADDSVRFAFHGSGAAVLHTDAGPVFHLFRAEDAGGAEAPDAAGRFAGRDGGEDAETAHTSFAARFDGADAVGPVGLERSDTVFNYFVGDRSGWRSGVSGYEVVAYMGLYDGIDLHTWGRRDSLKYEFHVAPGVDYTQIQVSYDGIEGLFIDEDGALHVRTELGEVVDEAPYVYQDIDGERIEVACEFILLDAETYAFDISGDYDVTAELIIDPDLDWATHLGGSDEDRCYEVAADGAGNAFVAGNTKSTDFDGVNNTHYGGTYDVFVAKVTSAGSQVWATYLGGDDWDLSGGVATDDDGNALVAGSTSSTNFAGANNPFHGGRYDAFLAKVTPAGILAWATHLGGTDFEEGHDVDVDGEGSAYITGHTTSSDFAGANNTYHGGLYDAYVVKVTGEGALDWTTYLGGAREDIGKGIAVNESGVVLVTGWTFSMDFAGANNSHYQCNDVFVAKVTPAGTQEWATYLGGSELDSGLGIAFDGAGGAWVSGETQSTNFAGVNNSYHGGHGDAFVAKVTAAGALEWATFLGGSEPDYGMDIVADSADSAIVIGWTRSSDFYGADNTYYGGFCDAFLVEVTSAGALSWATYMGGSGGDWGRGITTDEAGGTWMAGYTYSTDFAGANNSNHGDYDALVMYKAGPIAVVGRQIFYNNSYFDGNDALPNAADDGAVAPDKQALLPGQTATFANYTGYSRGINGVMVDIAGLAGTPTDADFIFKVGNSDEPGTWATAPAASSITVRPGAGRGGSDRVTIIWADNAVQKQWLQVTVLATANTGLAENDIFYWGNAVGETGNSATDAEVTPTDQVDTRNNPHTTGGPEGPADIDDAYDFNRDRKVVPTDEIIVRNNGTSSATALKLITVPDQIGGAGSAETGGDPQARSAPSNGSEFVLNVAAATAIAASDPVRPEASSRIGGLATGAVKTASARDEYFTPSSTFDAAAPRSVVAEHADKGPVNLLALEKKGVSPIVVRKEDNRICRVEIMELIPFFSLNDDPVMDLLAVLDPLRKRG